MARKNNNKKSDRLDRFLDRIVTTRFGETLFIYIARLRSRRSQAPSHVYYKCAYYSSENPQFSYLGYLTAGKKEASFMQMKFMTHDANTAPENNVNAHVRLLAMRPYGGTLMHIRRQAAEQGDHIFGKAVSNVKSPLFYYRLDREGKVVGKPRQLLDRAKLLRSETCYLFTDENRTFSLFLAASRTEFWDLPTF